MSDEEAFEIVNALKKAFNEGFELIKYRSGCYGMESYCDHLNTISDINDLLQYVEEK